MDKFEVGERAPLFFMHIPKTAGMSMRRYLNGQYHAQDICPYVRWTGLIGHEHEVRAFRLVQGHFGYNLRRLVAEDARMLVMLRDPLRRTVAALRNLQRDPAFHQDHLLAKDLTIGGILRHPGLMKKQRDVQARFLCASQTPDEVSTSVARQTADGGHAGAGVDENPPELELAKTRLASIDFVGLVDDIDAVVASMAETMGYHPPRHFRFIDNDPDDTDSLQSLSAEDIEILRDYNRVDLQLYGFATSLLERRAFVRGMSKLVQCGCYQVAPGSFSIPLSGVIPGSGWYEPERDGDVSWRWTGPRRHFTIEVPLRADASYRLQLIVGGRQRPADFTAEVNGTPVAFEPPEEGQHNTHVLMIPRSLLAESSGFCRIRFDTGQTTQRSADDIRKLGICVRGIEFECQYS